MNSDIAADPVVERVIGDSGLYRNGGRVPGRLSLSEAATAAHRGEGFVWIGLQQPDPAAVIAVAERFALPDLAVEEAVRAHQRPKLEVFDDIVFMILKPVHYVDHDEVVDVDQIALFVAPNFVVSVRHGTTDVLRRVRAELDAAPAPGSGLLAVPPRHSGNSAHANGRVHANGGTDGRAHANGGTNGRAHAGQGLHGDIPDGGVGYDAVLVPDRHDEPGRILFRAASLVVDGYLSALEAINEDIDEIESQVFDASDGRDRSERIYKLKREVAEFRRAALPLQEPLGRLATVQVPGWPGWSPAQLRDIQDDLLRTVEAVEAHDRLLSDVLQANLARVGTTQTAIALQQNEDMRRISAWAAIGLVPTGVAGVYGMNFDNMPELHWAYGYFMVVGIIASACTTLYRLFRRNNWL